MVYAPSVHPGLGHGPGIDDDYPIAAPTMR